ncbi:MAG: murein L,D-transpeptidase catalytic domain family protein [Nevskiales bacterium]
MTAIVLMFTGLGAGATAGSPGRKVPSPALLKQLLEKYQESRDRLGNRRYVALLDYRQPSWESRFFIIDPVTGQVVAQYVVAHGRGSDPDHDGYADRFGDKPESHRSTLGFFVTGETYLSESAGHGLSMRLEGLSKTNRNAKERDIVIHANWYVEPGFVAKKSKPGRSYGCLVFSDADRNAVIEKLKGGALIYTAY